MIKMGLKNNTLSGSSLANAVFLCLLVSLFCSALLIVSHFNTKVKTILEMHTSLINRNTSSFNYLTSNAASFPLHKMKEIRFFKDQMHSFGEKKKWGFYDILICKTIFKTDTVVKMALVCPRVKKTGVALFTTNYDKSLKVSGNVKIVGEMQVPNKKMEEIFINGLQGNEVSLKGTKKTSPRKFPKIAAPFFTDVKNGNHRIISAMENDVYVNGFDKETLVFDLSDVEELAKVTLKGNIVLFSNQLLKIPKNCLLTDVLISAPSVEIAAGFKGTIHIMATKKVTVHEDVSLLYPSSIYVKNELDSIRVVLHKNSKIIGNVLVDGHTNASAIKRELIIHKQATVVGAVYCHGKTQLQGTIIGSIYSDRFFLKTKTQNYENVILNATIDRDRLPNSFVELPILEASKMNAYEVVKLF